LIDELVERVLKRKKPPGASLAGDVAVVVERYGGVFAGNTPPH
jgi:hypothetical protein